jgi:hypothetical protein
MFATILRRWRLVTPLVLAVLAILIVSGSLTMPAAAHNIKFHFFGRAYALGDFSTVLPDVACDTGFLALVGTQSLDSGHCFGAAGFGVPGNGVTGTGRLLTIFAQDTVVSTHGNLTGRVTATADVEGNAGASEVVDLFTNTGFLRNTCCPGVANGGINFNQDCVLAPNESPTGGFIRGSDFEADLNGEDPDEGWQKFVDKADLCVPQVFNLVFVATHITQVAVAFCHRRSDGTTQATVSSATTNMVNPAVTENNVERFIGPNGLPNQSFTISGFVIFIPGFEGGFSPVSILVILNEQRPFVDGDVGAIAANAVHLVGTDSRGIVQFNFVIDHVFAGIHCAKHLGTEQNLGQFVGD